MTDRLKEFVSLETQPRGSATGALSRVPVYALPLSLVLLLAGCIGAGSAEPPARHAPAIQGITLDAPRRPQPGDLARLADLGATHLAVIPFGWQQTPNTPEVQFNPDARWYSESDGGIRTLDRQADSLGMHLVIKPHLWIRRASRADIDFPTEDEWRAWEDDYRALIMHYARLSADIGAPLYVIGTELATPARKRPAFWRTLIDSVRAVYDGELTYAANWWDEYEHITFWDALDYIGVQAYFPVGDTSAPRLAALEKGWTPHLEALEKLSMAVGRPVLFTEAGYRSVGYAAAEPWRWPERDEQAAPDPARQALLYEALFNRFWHRPWFEGAILWKWRPGAEDRAGDLDFTFQGKPAEDVIRRWYTEE